MKSKGFPNVAISGQQYNIEEKPSAAILLLLLFISHLLIRYESSRGHKIDGTKPNQTGNRR